MFHCKEFVFLFLGNSDETSLLFAGTAGHAFTRGLWRK